MDITVESEHAVKQGNTQSPKFTTNSASRLGMALMAMGFLLAAPYAKAQTAVSKADTNFILAAAQGGMTEVKLGELAAQKGTRADVDRKSTRLNSSHLVISYAVFCL